MSDVLDTPEAGGMVIRGGVIRAAGYAATVVLSVGAAALLTRHLGAGDFGRYITVFSLVAVVGSITEAGTTNLGIREYTIRSGDDRDRLMRNLLGMRTVLTLVGTLVGVVFALVAGYDEAMVLGTLLGGVGLLLTLLQATLAIPLAVALRQGAMTLLELLRQGATAVLIAVLVVAGAALLPFLAVPVPAGLLVLAATAFLVRGAIPLVPAYDRAEWVSLIRTTAAFAAATAVGAIYMYTTVILMSLVSTETETGFFGASFRVYAVVAGISGLLVAVAFPVLSRAARDDRERFTYATRRLFEVTLLVGAGFAAVTVVGAPVIIDVIAGSGFDEAVPTLRIQGIAILSAFVLATWGFALISLHEHRTLLIANGIGLVVTVTATLILAGPLGAEGAAISTAVADTVLCFSYLAFLRRVEPGTEAPLGTVLKVALATGLALAVMLVPDLPSLAAAAIAGVVYIGAVLVLRAVPDEIREHVLQRPGAS